MQWDTVIGLEIHVQLNTKSKLFSTAGTTFGAEANAQASFVDTALPGVLPVLNKEAIKMAMKLGLSINADIARTTVFARKNYFYPDLPKGYQISQDNLPILKNGFIDVSLADERFSTVAITRAHLEEDAGQSTHENEQAGYSGINLNRAGIPLIEIVTEPVISSADEALALLKSIRTLVRYLGISTGNMQEGAMRCDVNISVRPDKTSPLGNRVELKNINSFKFVEKAIKYEVDRQITMISSGKVIDQETRLYDSKKNITKTMRSKEDALDYRYFPDPDLTEINITEQDIEEIKKTLVELPSKKVKRLISEYNIKPSDAKIISLDINLANYFEEICKKTDTKYQNVANWICGDYLKLLKEHHISQSKNPVKAKCFIEMLKKINDNTISSSGGKIVLAKLFETADSVNEIIQKENLIQISNDEELIQMIEKVLHDNPTQLEQYKSGKDKLFGFFVGQVMKISQGKANPQLVNKLVKLALTKV